MDLSNKKCTPCVAGTPPLNQKTIEEYMKFVKEGWSVVENKKITKEYAFSNYKKTIDFVISVAELAEKEGHHPVMHVYYGKAVIELWTHSIDGLSENDFIMASKIDLILF